MTNPNPPHKSTPSYKEIIEWEYPSSLEGKSRGRKQLAPGRTYSVADAYGVNDRDEYWGDKVEGWE